MTSPPSRLAGQHSPSATCSPKGLAAHPHQQFHSPRGGRTTGQSQGMGPLGYGCSISGGHQRDDREGPAKRVCLVVHPQMTEPQPQASVAQCLQGHENQALSGQGAGQRISEEFCKSRVLRRSPSTSADRGDTHTALQPHHSTTGPIVPTNPQSLGRDSSPTVKPELSSMPGSVAL